VKAIVRRLDRVDFPPHSTQFHTEIVHSRISTEFGPMVFAAHAQEDREPVNRESCKRRAGSWDVVTIGKLPLLNQIKLACPRPSHV
jgi:hypothetical protein